MQNGRTAEVNAILSSGRDEIDRYLVTSVMEAKDAIHDLHDELEVTKSIKRWLMVIATAGITAVSLEAIHLVFPHLHI